MKKVTLLIVLLISILGCSDDDNLRLENETVVGKWNLSKVINNSLGGMSEPDPNQTHSYVFDNDGTFQRIAIEDKVRNELRGEYVLVDTDESYEVESPEILTLIKLTYAPDVVFFNCGALPDNQQLLILTTDNVLKNELEGICDGNSFLYTKQ
ncbi:hypothetical protein [Aquimarina algicola]|uniref:Lipocalin-like domain-containing protein n=1 Tax=Aquimarina algicola TaxID=2589995 RepID=A0A504JLS0_9FLAO|nr:hypothetical protein [Aquimarina algicola]TPN87561.1 hypothetical protein FHK87_08240 [Aquimarina algicola]